MKKYLLLLVCLIPLPVFAQESTREIEEGYESKYLTPNQMDTWKIQGIKDETIIVLVTTREFDPVLELATKDDKILVEVDDEGSESSFATRLPEQGEYNIRVHAFKYQGGGNYSIKIKRFMASNIVLENKTTANFDARGYSHIYFNASKGQILIPDILGFNLRESIVYDPKGHKIEGLWYETLPVKKDGDHYLSLRGEPNFKYSIIIKKARIMDLDENKSYSEKLGEKEMDVWRIMAKRGQFGVIDVAKKGFMVSQLIYAPTEDESKKKDPQDKYWNEITTLPVNSKGDRIRFAVVFGRSGRYELHLLAKSSAKYDIKISDPSETISPDTTENGVLSLGGAHFYTFNASSGQLFEITLTSASFDPVLGLYNKRGKLIVENDDAGTDLGSQIIVMIKEKGEYRVLVSSLGNGGGGPFALKLNEKKVREIKLGERLNGQTGTNALDYWSFSGKQGDCVIVNVRSEFLDPYIKIYNPAGVMIKSDDNSGIGTDSLAALKLTEDGNYLIEVQSRNGQGNYTIRLIDGE